MARTLRMDDETAEALRWLAESQGISQNEAIRRAVLASYRQASQLAAVRAVNEETRERWAGLLERLEKA